MGCPVRVKLLTSPTSGWMMAMMTCTASRFDSISHTHLLEVCCGVSTDYGDGVVTCHMTVSTDYGDGVVTCHMTVSPGAPCQCSCTTFCRLPVTAPCHCGAW